MSVNLYADRMMTTPPNSMYDVWGATSSHAAEYREAASLIGLSPAEYQEFRKDLLDGHATYIVLPRHIDAMAGMHGHEVYALRNVDVPAGERGWQVTLNDGTLVYVPNKCGNLSMNRARVAATPHFRAIAAYQVAKPAPLIPVPAPPPVTQVSFDAPAAVTDAPLSLPVSHISPWGFVPVLGGIITGVSGGGSPPVPPCSQGSNSMGFCHAGTTADYGN